MTAESPARCSWADESDLMREYHDTEWEETQWTTIGHTDSVSATWVAFKPDSIVHD